jgi:hypothetical protein
MEAEMVSETFGFYPQLSRLVAREDFIEFNRRESFIKFLSIFVPDDKVSLIAVSLSVTYSRIATQ